MCQIKKKKDILLYKSEEIVKNQRIDSNFFSYLHKHLQTMAHLKNDLPFLPLEHFVFISKQWFMLP